MDSCGGVILIDSSLTVCFLRVDMYAIVDVWSNIVTDVHTDYPHLLAEMFGYNLAAAHLQLKHMIAFSFMVSDIYAGGEGWKLVDQVPQDTDMCHGYPPAERPHVIHYCQKYGLGKWFFGKYRLRKDFISCHAPLLRVPPSDIAIRYNSTHIHFKDVDYKPKEVREEAFVLCAMIDAMNDAAMYYKDNNCDPATANYVFNYTFFRDMRMDFEIPHSPGEKL